MHDDEPDPLVRRCLVLREIALALQEGTPLTVAQMFVEAVDAYRKNRIGPNAKSVAVVVPLTRAAAIVTWMVERGIKVPAAYTAVAKDTGVDRTKLESFRESLQRGTQAKDTMINYRFHLDALRAYSQHPAQA